MNCTRKTSAHGCCVVVVIIIIAGAAVMVVVVVGEEEEDTERARQPAMTQLTEGTVCTKVQSHLPCFF
jgi:hypothetical protein